MTSNDAEVLFEKAGESYSSRVKLILDPQVLGVASNPLALRILSSTAEKPAYAREIGRSLGISEQTVYYHVKRLMNAGLLEVVESSAIRGAVAKKVAASSSGIALLYRPSTAIRVAKDARRTPLVAFFREFIVDHVFNGYFVVGSPEPHGPFRAAARDGHYAAQLGFALGALATTDDDFSVRLDTDVKAEKAYDSHLVLFGGPATNLLTAEVNRLLPVRFDESNYWAGLMDGMGRRFNGETDAVIAKVPSPFAQGRSVVVLAGIRHVGTKSAVIGLTRQPGDVLSTYDGQPTFACVVKGYDQDGDGKVDHVDVLARYP
jgi:DNA-binding transcriptional ArsR family regulator